MKTRTVLAGATLLLLAAVAPAAAQSIAPATPDTNNRPESMSTTDPSYYQHEKLTGQITHVDADTNTILLRDSKSGVSYTLHVTKDTQFKADKNSDLAGRKNLSLADFKEGHTVKVTLRPTDNKLLEVRLRPDRK